MCSVLYISLNISFKRFCYLTLCNKATFIYLLTTHLLKCHKHSKLGKWLSQYCFPLAFETAKWPHVWRCLQGHVRWAVTWREPWVPGSLSNRATPLLSLNAFMLFYFWVTYPLHKKWSKFNPNCEKKKRLFLGFENISPNLPYLNICMKRCWRCNRWNVEPILELNLRSYKMNEPS